eukprot:CAMPEP_0206320246 /NCGR_PEP_ID=MMETSP0106_2-20121207/18211_1 /ASSEMBLY_ACC=CAM_ASM_000206 /TAXON_ID=81532 /ORGANISM="Acanthoeca-like sp., Strain 10tr" /LENGTH=49 /DNA_ID= /DNA_START= /DNA_END= /DNA_ORIENTATION=
MLKAVRLGHLDVVCEAPFGVPDSQITRRAVGELKVHRYIGDGLARPGAE